MSWHLKILIKRINCFAYFEKSVKLIFSQMNIDSTDARTIDSGYDLSSIFSIDSMIWIQFWLRPRISATNQAIGVLNVPTDSLVYDMKHSQRGKCLIFNHQTFDSSTGCRPRLGTDKDANSVARCFHNLEFDVIQYMDASYRDIKDSLIKGRFTSSFTI